MKPLGEDQNGGIDIVELERKLQECTQSRSSSSSNNRLLIGSFSAASNVTGILADTDKISILLHRYGALACWDYASAAPYLKVDMNPVGRAEGGAGEGEGMRDRNLAYKDAIFLSPHKFIGGKGMPTLIDNSSI